MALESILGGLVGLGGSVVPAILDYKNKQKERSHVEEMRKIEMDALKLGHAFQLEQTEIGAAQTETAAVYAHDQSLSEGGGPFIRSMRASVRPIITYVFFILYIAVKICAIYTAWWIQSVPLAPALMALWTENDAALFATIMGFWFGQRSLLKFGYGPAIASPQIVTKASRHSK